MANLTDFITLWEEDNLTAIKSMFFYRDRKFKGNKISFREILRWIATNQTQMFRKILVNVLTYGNYNDLTSLYDHEIASNIVIEFLSKQLKKDFDKMSSGNKISILAKFMPTEGVTTDRKYNLVNRYCKALKISKKTYRTKYIVPMRKILIPIHHYVNRKEWGKIDYCKIALSDRKRYSDLFLEFDEIRYLDYCRSTDDLDDEDKIKIEEVGLVKKYLDLLDLDQIKVDDLVYNSVEESKWFELSYSWTIFSDKAPIFILDFDDSMWRFSLPIALALVIIYFYRMEETEEERIFYIMSLATKHSIVEDTQNLQEYLKLLITAMLEKTKVSSYQDIIDTDRPIIILTNKSYDSCRREKDILVINSTKDTDQDTDQDIEQYLKLDLKLDLNLDLDSPTSKDFDNKYKILHWSIVNQQPRFKDRDTTLEITGYSDDLFRRLLVGDIPDINNLLDIHLSNNRYDKIELIDGV